MCCGDTFIYSATKHYTQIDSQKKSLKEVLTPLFHTEKLRVEHRVSDRELHESFTVTYLLG